MTVELSTEALLELVRLQHAAIAAVRPLLLTATADVNEALLAAGITTPALVELVDVEKAFARGEATLTAARRLGLIS